jgi:hypothetical protein
LKKYNFSAKHVNIRSSAVYHYWSHKYYACILSHISHNPSETKILNTIHQIWGLISHLYPHPNINEINNNVLCLFDLQSCSHSFLISSSFTNYRAILIYRRVIIHLNKRILVSHYVFFFSPWLDIPFRRIILYSGFVNLLVITSYHTLSSWNHHLVSLGDLPFLQFFT